MSHNSGSAMQEAMRLLDRILAIDAENPHALPGSSLRYIKNAKKVLTRDVRKRRDGRARELLRHGAPE